METEIKKGRGRPRFDISDNVKSDVCLYYNEGMSIGDAGKRAGVGVVIAKRILTERGVTIRGKKMA